MKQTTPLLILFFIGLFSANLHSQNFDEAQKLVASDRDMTDRFSSSLDISGDYAIIGADRESEDANGLNTLNFAGSAYIYERDTNGVWTEGQKLVASDREANNNFGISTAISGDYAIVGAIFNRLDETGNNPINGAGAVYIFKRDINGNWLETQKIVASDRGFGDFFGNQVSISDDLLIVGAYRDDEDENDTNTINDSGAAYIFERDINGLWIEVQKIVASDRSAESEFGSQVSISGTTIIVSAIGENFDQNGMNFLFGAGAAYIFERDMSGTWVETQKIIASDRGDGDEFGATVSISNDYLIIGTYLEDEDVSGANSLNNSGAAYIFEKDVNGNWIEIQKIVASDRNDYDYFGVDVAMFGDYVIVGAASEDEDASGNNPLSGAGSGYIFKRDANGVWLEIQKIVTSDRDLNDLFGFRVAISNNIILVGALSESHDANGANELPYAGAAYVFELPAANILIDGNGDLEFTDNDDRDDDLTITINGTNYRLTDPINPLTAGAGAVQIDANTIDIPIASVTGDITINTNGGDDSFTTDFSGGNITDNIYYDGGAQNNTNPGDILTLQGGGTFATVEHLLENESDGSVGITGNGFIRYLGLEPVIDNLDVVDRVFTFTGAAETITLQNEATPGFNNIDSTQAELVTFTNPTNSLTISTESFNIPGIDTVNIEGVDAGFDADLNINAGTDDTVRFQTNPTHIGTGTYGVIAGYIKGFANISTLGFGAINFNATHTIEVTSIITAEDGDINFNANTSGTSAGANSSGVKIDTATVTTTGMGSIMFNGTGSTTVFNGIYGVNITEGATVEATGSGSITLIGTGADGTAANLGIAIQNNSIVRTTGAGMQFNGTGGNGPGIDNAGIYIGFNTTVEDLAGGNINVNGTGSGTGTDRNFGIVMDGGITTTIGDINLTGQGSLTSTGINNDGIWLFGNDVTIETQEGTITLNGTSGAGTNNNDGIQIETGAVVQATGIGSIVLDGTSTGGDNDNNGIYIDGVSTTISTAGGSIAVTGQGAISGTADANRGVLLSGGAAINNIGTGAINIMGTGGDGTNFNYGVELKGGTIVQSDDGSISINGTSGLGSGSSNYGISMNTSTVEAIAMGMIMIDGTSAGSNGEGNGVDLNTTEVRASGGGITITGQGALISSGMFNYGVLIGNTTIQDTNGGQVIIDGISGVGTSVSDIGVYINTATISATGANVIVNGISNSTSNSPGGISPGVALFSNSLVNTIGSGNIQVTGTAASPSNIALIVFPTAGIFSAETATITAVTGPFKTLDGIPASSLIQGSTVTLNGIFDPGFNMPGELPITGNTALSLGDELTIDINGETTPGTDYNQLAVTGTVDITDATLTLVDNIAAPISSGAQFTIIENDGADAILGNFNGLAEGAIIPFNGQTLRLSYVGGDGNDVVLEEVVVGTLSIVATTQAAEDATNGLFTITASQQFLTNTNVTFSVAGTATSGTDFTALGTSFTFPANTNSVTITVPVIADDLVEPDETVIVTLTGTDNLNVSIGASDSATVTISDNDEAPIITQGIIFTIDENLPNTTPIGNIIATDADAGTSFENWSILSGNTSIDGDMDGPFAINSTTGLLTVNDSGDLDFESGTTSFTLSITVSDGTNTSAPETVIININDVDECDPLVPVTNPITVALMGTSYTLTQTDKDAITSGSTGTNLSFSFSQETFNCSQSPSVDITVTFTDACGSSSNEIVTILVEDDSAPTAVCQNITVQLDAFGQATITPDQLDGGSTDNCSTVLTFNASQTDFTCADLATADTPLAPLLITGVIDADLTGGTPKAVELKVQEDIADLSLYGIGSANNGGGSDGEEFTFPADAVTAGTYIYIATDDAMFSAFFGFDPTYINGAVAINGDDAVELFFNGTVIDTFGDINVNGDGQAWEYTDGWAYRNNEQTTNAGVFNPNNWSYSGPTALDNETTNSTAATPFPLGTFTTTPTTTSTVSVVLTVTDETGNTAMCTALVTVEDILPPTITCPENVEAVTDLGQCTATNVALGSPSVFDNCSVMSITNDAPAVYPLGITVVTWTVTDTSGNANTCLQEVSITDNELPIAVCQNFTIQLDATGTASIAPEELDGGSTDNCTIASIYISQDTFTCDDLGDNLVTLFVEDASGNVQECTAIITVEDIIPPTLVCMNISEELDANGMVILDYTQLIDPASTDNCAIVDGSLSISEFNCTNIGDNTVTLTVVDASGNEATCTAIVTVLDNSIPVASCQNITVTLDDMGMATITPEQLDAGSDNNCGNVTLSIDIDTFDCTNVGDNTVTLTVTSDNGAMASCEATVTVIEETAPIALCQDITVTLDDTGVATITPDLLDAGSTDNCGVVTLSLDQDTFTCANVGENIVTLIATDASGNTAICPATVTVVDATNPMAICQDLTIVLDENGLASIVAEDINNGSSDACGISEISIDIDTFSCANFGDNSVTLTVTDSNGNTSSCVATVTVTQIVEAPIAMCTNITVTLDENGMATITPANIDGGSSGNGCSNGLSIDIDTFTCADVGLNDVTLTVTNGDGETASCVATVNIVDTLAPIITCPEDVVVIAALAPYELPDFVDNDTVIVTDNCLDTLTITQDPAVGTVVEEGETAVTIIVTDPSGNEIACSFNIFVDPSLGNDVYAANLKTLSLYPNPASDFMILENPKNLALKNARLIDMTGRIVKQFDLSRLSTERVLDISEIASANYFLIVEGKTENVSFQIIKR